MDQSKLKRFIEQTYCIEYNPEHVASLKHKNTGKMKCFMYKPYKTGFLQTEFYYDTVNKKFVRLVNGVDWDPLSDDTFS